jgi:hypothetical protein
MESELFVSSAEGVVFIIIAFIVIGGVVLAVTSNGSGGSGGSGSSCSSGSSCGGGCGGGCGG